MASCYPQWAVAGGENSTENKSYSGGKLCSARAPRHLGEEEREETRAWMRAYEHAARSGEREAGAALYNGE